MCWCLRYPPVHRRGSSIGWPEWREENKTEFTCTQRKIWSGNNSNNRILHCYVLYGQTWSIARPLCNTRTDGRTDERTGVHVSSCRDCFHDGGPSSWWTALVFDVGESPATIFDLHWQQIWEDAENRRSRRGACGCLWYHLTQRVVSLFGLVFRLIWTLVTYRPTLTGLNE